MTREEMIEQLDNTILLIRQNGKDWWDERDIPILEEAIKAMKMKTCKDVISRQAAISVANGFDCGMVVRGLEKLPSVQPMQRTGKWIPRNSFLLRYKCSECEWESEEYNYCPNCGAKMEGE